jgi:hypothetical protein
MLAAAFAVVTAMVLVEPLPAQPREATAIPRLCFRGRPKPTCDRFAITEIGLYHPVLRSRREYDLGSRQLSYPDVERQGTAQIGGMVNRSANTAVGGTILFGLGTGAADFGVIGRYRRWLSSDGMSIDVGAGVIQGNIDGSSVADARGMMAELALNAADYGALIVRTDVLRARGETNAALFSGVRVGSRPAIATGVVLAIGFSLLLAALADADY